jgi:VanZ family protein
MILGFWRSTVPYLRLVFFCGYALTLLWLSLASDPPQPQVSWPHKDKIGHALAYGLMTLLGGWALSRGRIMTLRHLAWGLGIAMIFGGSMEILQGLMTVHRHAEWLDLAANLAGGLTVFAVGWWWLKRRDDLRLSGSHPQGNSRRSL